MIAVAAAAGLLIGLALGALGGGGSILAVPVLVHLVGQSPAEATPGSLVVVGATSVIGAVVAGRAGHLRLGRGLAFGAIAIGGSVLGARAATAVPEELLMALLSLLMLGVAALMVRRLRRHREAGAVGPAPRLDDPIVALRRGGLTCDCPRALQLLATATAVGALTGFLGVGGGFVVVPALLLVFDLPMPDAVGTSLVVIAVTSAAALAVRTGSDVAVDWPPVLGLTAVAAVGALLGGRVAARVDATRLHGAFALLVLVVATHHRPGRTRRARPADLTRPARLGHRPGRDVPSSPTTPEETPCADRPPAPAARSRGPAAASTSTRSSPWCPPSSGATASTDPRSREVRRGGPCSLGVMGRGSTGASVVWPLVRIPAPSLYDQ